MGARSRRLLPLFVLLLSCLPWVDAAWAQTGSEEPAPWCAPELQAIASSNCFWLAERDGSGTKRKQESLRVPEKTLVIFLHGLTGDSKNWQWGEQRLMVRLAQTYGFSALLPRGRKGIGPGRDPHVWAWPNSKRAQAEVEASLLEELDATRAALAKKAGGFDRTFVFGFSNGAYYATSLAFRQKLSIDGYAMFAGGSGNEYDSLLAARVKQRVPIFVGYGKKDPDRQRQKDLIYLLAKLGWKHRGLGADVGHTVTPAQLEAALTFLLNAEPRPS